VDCRRDVWLADQVRLRTGVVTVFNIKGNRSTFGRRGGVSVGLVVVRRIMTHEEYDESRWKGATMKEAAIKVAGFRASDSYLRCVKQFALRPLKGEEEYRTAIDMLGRLAARAGIDDGGAGYVRGLSQFVGDYERGRHRIGTTE